MISVKWIITLNVQNVHHWLTHISAVACGLSQRCQRLSLVRQTKLTKVHLLNSGTVFDFYFSSPALPQTS